MKKYNREYQNRGTEQAPVWELTELSCCEPSLTVDNVTEIEQSGYITMISTAGADGSQKISDFLAEKAGTSNYTVLRAQRCGDTTDPSLAWSWVDGEWLGNQRGPYHPEFNGYDGSYYSHYIVDCVIDGNNGVTWNQFELLVHAGQTLREFQISTTPACPEHKIAWAINSSNEYTTLDMGQTSFSVFLKNSEVRLEPAASNIQRNQTIDQWINAQMGGGNWTYVRSQTCASGYTTLPHDYRNKYAQQSCDKPFGINVGVTWRAHEIIDTTVPSSVTLNLKLVSESGVDLDWSMDHLLF